MYKAKILMLGPCKVSSTYVTLCRYIVDLDLIRNVYTHNQWKELEGYNLNFVEEVMSGRWGGTSHEG